MPQSVYKVIEVIGTSPKSWEEAAKSAVELAGEHLRELRVAEVVEQDLVITDGKVEKDLAPLLTGPATAMAGPVIVHTLA